MVRMRPGERGSCGNRLTWVMWKWIIGGIAVLLMAAGGTAYYVSDKIYLRFEHATVTAQNFDRKYSPAQLAADYRSVRASVARRENTDRSRGAAKSINALT